MTNRIVPPALALAAIFWVGGVSVADDGRILSDKWYVTVGGYLAEITTDASVGTGGIVGTLIQVEDQLGLDDRKSTFHLLANRRLGRRHTLGLEYFKIGRSGETVLTESIEFDGKTYNFGVSLASTFDTELYQLTYKYSFFNDGKSEAGLQAGLSTWRLTAELAGEASVDDGMGGVTTEFARAGEDLLAPVPAVGLFVRHAFTPKLVMLANARFLRVTLGDIEGRLVDTALSLDYFFSKHVGIGVGLNGTDMRYKDSGDKPALFEYRQSGLVAYASMVF